MFYPWVIFQLTERFIRAQALDPRGPIVEALEETRFQVLWLVIIVQVLFMVVTFLISLFLSHRIAGPLHKLKQTFKRAEEGYIDDEIKFREGDHFQDLADSYNHMMGTIRSSRDTAIFHVERAIASAQGESKSELEQALKSLKESRETAPS